MAYQDHRPFAAFLIRLLVDCFSFIHQEGLTPQSSAQDLRIKPLLVFADLWRVVLWPRVDRIDVDHRTLPGRVLTQSLLQSSVVTVA